MEFDASYFDEKKDRRIHYVSKIPHCQSCLADQEIDPPYLDDPCCCAHKQELEHGFKSSLLVIKEHGETR